MYAELLQKGVDAMGLAVGVTEVDVVDWKLEIGV